MKIAVDGGPITSGHSFRGIGTYTRELLAALKVKGVDVWQKDLRKYDVVHFTSFNPFLISVPFAKPKKTKFVLTIYDLIPLIYPAHYPPGIRGRINFFLNKYLINKNVDVIITISETSKKDICRFLGVRPKIVYVTYLAPREIFKRTTDTSLLYSIKVKYKLPKKFVLYTGDVNFNKNIPGLIEACKIVKIPLVIAGKQVKDIENQNLDHPELSHLKNLDWSNTIRPGFVPDKDLAAIYNLASVYVQPSFYEGFGLPVLEAFACGCPVVCAKTQALVEIAENAALFVNPRDTGDMVRGIKKVVTDEKLRKNLIEEGLKRVDNFSWQKAAQETLAVYKKVS